MIFENSRVLEYFNDGVPGLWRSLWNEASEAFKETRLKVESLHTRTEACLPASLQNMFQLSFITCQDN